MMIVRDRAHEGYDILLKCLYDAHGRFERKNAAVEGKVKDAKCFKDMPVREYNQVTNYID